MGVFAASLDSLVWMLSGMLPQSAGTAVAGPVAYSADLDLVRRVQARDRKAIADLVTDHAGAIHSYVQFRLAPQSDRADDVVQDVFLAAWQSLDAYRGDSSLRNWFIGIARHKIEDVYRQRLREPDPLPEEDGADELPALEPLFDAEIDRARLRKRAAAVLGELPEPYSAVLLWRYWDHRPLAEIAAATGKTEKAIERLLSRARTSFRRRWEDGG